MSDKQKATVSFPLLGILGLIFITLKLTGHITWSWWWGTAPFWGGFVLVLGIMALLGGVLATVALLAALLDRWR